jgi:tetratricopeptide (TPR) repeat protein
MQSGGVRRKNTSLGGAAARPVSRAYNERVVIGIICVFLAVTVWIAFGQTLRHEFINYDDDEYVYENPTVTSGLTLRGIQWAFTHIHAGNWHPLTTISHMLDCQLYGLQPWGHHLTNVLLHTAAAIFLFLALRRLTGTLWPSALVAAIFAIHPLHVESVAWVSERKDVLSGVFFALTLWAYARYARGDQPSPGRYEIVLILFALGLMCKPTLVTVPFVLLLLDYWPLRRFDTVQSFRPLVVEKIPLFVLSAASCVVTILAQQEAIIGIRQLTFAERVANAVVSYLVYLGKTLYPAHLAAVYPYPRDHLPVAQAIPAFLFLLIISATFFLCRRKYPFLLVGWLWFLGMLVPMIGIVQVGQQPWADRYTYLPQIGLCIMAVWGATELLSHWRRQREVAIAIAVVIIAGLLVQSCLQTSYWRNSEVLWKQALANTLNNHIAENNLGAYFLTKGRLDEAAVHFREAIRIYPTYPKAHNNLGYVLATKGNWAEAIPFYEAALRSQPAYAKAHNNLAIALAQVGRTGEALAHFHEALRIDENYADAHCNLGILLLRLGRRDEAVTQLRESLRIKPDDVEVKEQLLQLGVNDAVSPTQSGKK